MKSLNSTALSVILLVLALVAASTKSTFAYIDGGSASFIIQVLAASLFASLFTVKLFWRRITGALSTILVKVRKDTKTDA